MEISKCCIILHAGSAESWETNPEHQRTIEKTLRAIAAEAYSKLSSGIKAIDVVEFAVSALEDCQSFNAGKGSALNECGKHELEAVIVDQNGSYGAVACVKRIKNPVRAARVILNRRPNTYLVGPPADKMAYKAGLEMVPNNYYTTARRKAFWEKTVKYIRVKRHNQGIGNIIHDDDSAGPDDLESVGAVALDAYGNLAASGSTGGLTYKRQGRSRDTIVLGAGIYANSQLAIVCGDGDEMLRNLVASKVLELRQSLPLDDATSDTIVKTSKKACAILALDSEGQISIQSTARAFLTAIHISSRASTAVIGPTIHILPPQIFHKSTLVTAGLTRYPITSGHIVIVGNEAKDLMSYTLSDFLEILLTARQTSSAMCSVMGLNRCGLICDGRNVIPLIPLHGLSQGWKQVVHTKEEYNGTYLGYLTTKIGPKMEDHYLEWIKNKIRIFSHIPEPPNYHFNGDSSDMNLFARIIRGEISQWRIWEDEAHVAFITPFANTPGVTVLVPRKHLSSDVFSLNDRDFEYMVKAAYQVAQYLKVALGLQRCGMAFEGFEIDYAHIKLIPVHDQELVDGQPFTVLSGLSEFHEAYEGYLTSQFGPFESDDAMLTRNAEEMMSLFGKS